MDIAAESIGTYMELSNFRIEFKPVSTARLKRALPTSLDRAYRGGVILTPEGLSSLVALVRRHMSENPPPPHEWNRSDYENLSITYRCDDSSSVDFATLEDALAFQHPPSRRIKSVIVSNSYSNPFHIRIHLRSEPILGVANLDLKGDDSRVVRFKFDFENWLSTMKAFWSPAVYFGAFPYLLPAVFLSGPALDYHNLSQGGRVWFWSILGASIGLYLTLRFFFPSFCVTIGHGRERFERLKGIQKWIISTAVLGTVLGIVARIAYDHLK